MDVLMYQYHTYINEVLNGCQYNMQYINDVRNIRYINIIFTNYIPDIHGMKGLNPTMEVYDRLCFDFGKMKNRDKKRETYITYWKQLSQT